MIEKKYFPDKIVEKRTRFRKMDTHDRSTHAAERTRVCRERSSARLATRTIGGNYKFDWVEEVEVGER